MDERTLIFQKLQKGEVIFTLEKDKRKTGGLVIPFSIPQRL